MFEAGWQAGNKIDDRPLRIGSWQPANFDGKFRGPITLDEAFGAFGQHLGHPPGADRRCRDKVGPAHCRCSSNLQPVPSITWGIGSDPALNRAYLPFASGGIRRPLYGVVTVSDDGGKSYYRRGHGRCGRRRAGP